MDNLVKAVELVQMIEKRQSILISALEGVAHHDNWIDKQTQIASAEKYGKSPCGEHLKKVAEGKIRC